MNNDNGAELADLLKEEDLPPPDDPEIVPTASRTDLLFACTFPWGKRAPKVPIGSGARFGLAFHKALEMTLKGQHFDFDELAMKYGIDVRELADRCGQSALAIEEFISGKNHSGLNLDDIKDSFCVEVSVAYKPVTDKARFCMAPTEEDHTYPDRQFDEIPGTADLVAFHDDTMLIIDHKSGWQVGASWQPQTPAESGQLRTLALALSRIMAGTKEVVVGFLHAPRDQPVEIYADKLTLEDLEQHRKDLRAAMSQIGSGWMRPGEWCPHCPGFSICPAQSSALIELKRGKGPLSASKVGAIHQATALYDQLRDRLREEIRGWVKIHGPGIRPDGKSVELVEVEKSYLSQASVERALGPLKGRKEIERLRKLGCIEVKSQVELRAVKR